MLALLSANTLRAQDVVDVSTLDISKMTAGWSEAKRDQSIAGQPLRIRGATFQHGVGTHALSNLRIRLGGKGERFRASVGIDDSAGGKGSAEFQVIADGNVVWASGLMTGVDEPKHVDVAIRNADVLQLRVIPGEDGTGDDHADWIGPAIIMATNSQAPFAIEPYESFNIQAGAFALHFFVGIDGRLYQTPIGLQEPPSPPPRYDVAFPEGGDGYVFEPALQAVHADGNRSLSLVFAGIQRKRRDDQTEEVRILLRDKDFPFEVVLCFRTHETSGVIEQWTEISHRESGPVTLERMASSSLQLNAGNISLLHFYGNWSNEMNPYVDHLSPGIKILDSKLGVRTNQFTLPSFVLSLDGSPQESAGRVLAGSLAWSGNFQVALDDTGDRIRVLSGLNPFASEYHLAPNETFTTPVMVWVWSDSGLGDMSRRLHRWARDHGLRDGHTPRETLLNNWEATGFNFDADRLIGLLEPAKSLGLELFLLDDGWFGNAHPRLADNAGLGDWEPNSKRFPRGIAPVAKAARDLGLRFGIWIEPEMVNPRSELYEQHPDWVIRQPKRSDELQRNQMVLDLTRPEVQAFEWDVIKKTLSESSVSYAKWDANRYITQPGSSYLPADRQTHLWIDYTKALYALMEKTASDFPSTELMLCSGGGGRVDYGALKFFHEFWPSDNTDAVRRVAMQWDYSYFFPSIAICSHVSRAGDRPLHFATAVAMSARFGMDIDVTKFTPEEADVCSQAITSYKRLRDVIHLGDLFRTENPHEGDRCVFNYVTEDRTRAVAFVYQLRDGAPRPFKFQGLDPARTYIARDAHPERGRKKLPAEGQQILGSELMNQGVALSTAQAISATIVELDAKE